MPFGTNSQPKLTTRKDWVAWPYIDTLYDYVAFITNGGKTDDCAIATLPKELWGIEVAIIGAGAAGLVAAYELLKIGATPIIYEATNRIGGRGYSLKFPSSDVFAEMGSMRFPPSGKLFFHYVNDVFKFNLGDSTPFPDPGSVPTKLYYENNIIDWRVGALAPNDPDFQRIGQDWAKFVTKLTKPLYEVWENEQWDKVQQIWQSYIYQYQDKSFYAGVREGIPQWSDEDMNKFGALGIGSGGFGPLYQVNFLEILRIIVNMWEDNQQFLPFGISKVMKKFYTQPVLKPDGRHESLRDIKAVRINTPVTAIESGRDGNPIVHCKDPVQGLQSQSFKAVIVAISTRSMEMIGMTLPPVDAKPIVEESVETALRNLHIMDSSKLFIRTQTKFWKDDPSIPQNIQTDELPRGVYALDYPHTENGVVLISYTWGDDSTKLLGLPLQKRFQVFKQAIAKVSPKFAEHLELINPEHDILSIDWERQEFYYGAFKLQYPGQEPSIQAAYYQFLSVLDSKIDRGVYLAGDGVSWSGGWTEGALHTGLNAACAAAQRIGANIRENSPLTQNPNLYHYGKPPSSQADLVVEG